MSNTHMRLVRLQRCGSPTRKAVLFDLADRANDSGECYPSVARIANDTELSERAVRDALRALESAGLIRSSARSGTSTIYTLTLRTTAGGAAPATHSAPASDAEGQETPPTPAGGADLPRQDVPPTPAPAAPKPSMNHQLNHQGTPTNGVGKPARTTIGMTELMAEGVEQQHAEDWLTVRKAKRAPLTRAAWDDLKAEATKAGITPAEAVRIAAASSWQGFKASWLHSEGGNRAPSKPKSSATHGDFAKRDYGQGGLLGDISSDSANGGRRDVVQRI